MTDLALYRKHRPTEFSDLVGQDHVQKTILNAVKSGHLSHAYLFCGPRGTGKTSTARLVAKVINCINPQEDGESCNQCEYCLATNEGNLVDLIEIDAASNRGIDEIRDLREKINFAPNQAPHKVYIIDEVHMLTTPAFNALLKTLEEPPSHAYFILATTEIHKVPDTIISRCQRFDFRRLNNGDIVNQLKLIAKKEEIKVEEKALNEIAYASLGGMRDAIGLFEQATTDGTLTMEHLQSILGTTGHDRVQKFIEALEKEAFQEALTEIQTLHFEGHDLIQFNRDVLKLLRKRLLDSISKPELSERYLHWVDLFQKAAVDSKQSIIAQLPLEMAVIKIGLARKEKPGILEALFKEKSPQESPSKPLPKPKAEKSSPSIDQTEALKSIPEEGEDATLDLETVKAKLPRVLESIATPPVRQAFKMGVFTQLENSNLHVEFQSNFYLEKVKTTANMQEIEQALASVFGRPLQLKPSLATMDDLVEKTLEIFGGEVIE